MAYACYRGQAHSTGFALLYKKARTILKPRFPIWQAPTGSIAGPELCAAVSRAGGMGALGLTWTSPEAAAQAVRKVRAEVDESPFLGNFALAFPPNALRAALEAGLPIAAFSWGDPTPYLDLCRSHGALVGAQVGNLEGAQILRGKVDFLVAQGVEAGGHVQSTTALTGLLPQLIDLGLPVIAAGGLADGRDVRRVLDLGAAGAMLGTRFVATRESRAHDAYKRALLEGSQTALTHLFDGGWPHAPHRVLRNPTLETWEAVGCPPPGARPNEGEKLGHAPGGPVLRYEDAAPRQGFEGRIEEMCLYAGMGVGKIHDLPSAGDLVRRLATEAELGTRSV